MIVGLPGTGIGGLFYLGMALLMPLREIAVTLKGRSSVARWRFIGLNLVLVAGILACLWAFMWGVKALLGWIGLDQPGGLLTASRSGAELARDTTTFFAAAAWASALSLGALIVLVHALRLTVARHARVRQTPGTLPPPLSHAGGTTS